MKEHQELVRQLRNGDEQAAVRLVGRYGERLYQAARQLCGNEADARDLMSETIERAFFGIAAFREEAALFSWLYGILLNVRRMKARKDRRSPVIYVARLPEVEEEGAEVGQAFDARVTAACVGAAIQRLPPAQQEVVQLRFYGDLRLREIAAALALKPGTVKSRLRKALRLLGKELAREAVRL